MSDKIVGVVSVNGGGLKCVAFDADKWDALAVGDIIYAPREPEPVNFEAEYELPKYDQAPVYDDDPLQVSFDGAEGGAVWIHSRREDYMLAIRGPEAMREMARLLVACADAHGKGSTNEA